MSDSKEALSDKEECLLNLEKYWKSKVDLAIERTKSASGEGKSYYIFRLEEDKYTDVSEDNIRCFRFLIEKRGFETSVQKENNNCGGYMNVEITISCIPLDDE